MHPRNKSESKLLQSTARSVEQWAWPIRLLDSEFMAYLNTVWYKEKNNSVIWFYRAFSGIKMSSGRKGGNSPWCFEDGWKVEKAAVPEVQYRKNWPLHPKLHMPIKECCKSKWQHQMHAIGVVAKLHPSKTERLFNEAFTTKEHSSSSSIASLLVYPKRVLLHLAAGLLINTCWSTEMIMMLLHPVMEIHQI